MTTISYKWVNKETGEVRITKSWPEVQDWVEHEGGSYETIYNSSKSQSEAFCRVDARNPKTEGFGRRY